MSGEIRATFFEQVFTTHPELRGVYSDPGLFFKDLLVKEKIVGLLGKLAYEIFEVFYSEPMLVINPEIYTPQN
jgi:hemoglobin-like flavoprotein